MSAYDLVNSCLFFIESGLVPSVEEKIGTKL